MDAQWRSLCPSIAWGRGVLKEGPICGVSYITDTINVTRTHIYFGNVVSLVCFAYDMRVESE